MAKPTPPDSSPPFSPLLAIPFGILAVSTASIFIRFAQTEADSLVIAAYRLSLASLILLPLAVRRHLQELRQLGRRRFLLGLVSGLFLALHFASWISSLEYTTVASSVVLVATMPLWVAVVAPFILGEKLTPPVLGGLVIALAGSVVVGLSDSCQTSPSGLSCPSLSEFVQGEAFWGDFLALVGAWMGAGYLLIGRRMRAGLSLVAYIFVVYGIAALALIGIVGVLRLPVLGYSPLTYLWFFLLAVIPQLLGHSTFNWALRYLPAAFVSITLLGEPIGSSVLAYVILAEVPSGMKIIGAILILSGIVLASRQQSNSR